MAIDHEVSSDGVFFKSKENAKQYADAYDKDLREVNGLWLAANRATSSGPMPTNEGGVIIFHLHQKYVVWIATWDGAQGPDPNVQPAVFWSADEAKKDALGQADETGGQIYLLQKDGSWARMTM